MQQRLIIIGFGTVGQGLVEILLTKKKELQEKHNFHYAIVAVSDWQKGVIASAAGLDEDTLLSLINI